MVFLFLPVWCRLDNALERIEPGLIISLITRSPAPATSFKRQAPITQVVGAFCFSASVRWQIPVFPAAVRGARPSPGLRCSGRRIPDANLPVARPRVISLDYQLIACVFPIAGVSSRLAPGCRHAVPQASEVFAVKVYARNRVGSGVFLAGRGRSKKCPGQPA